METEEPKKVLICYASDENGVSWAFRSTEQREIFFTQSQNALPISAKAVWENTSSVWIINYTHRCLHVMERMIRENGKTRILSS